MPTALPSPPALSQPFSAGTSSVARAQGSEAGHRDSPQDRQVLQGKVCPVLPGIPVEHWPSLTASHFIPSTSGGCYDSYQAAVILTGHLNEKGERVEVQEGEEDVLILFSLPVSPHEFSNDSGHGVPLS